MSRAEQLKAKYINSGERGRGALREKLAKVYLELLFYKWPVRIIETGIGVGHDRYVPETYHGLEDKFDYALIAEDPGKKIYVEVTGTPYTRRDSIKRFGQAVIGILPDKQKEAERSRDPVFYMIIAEAEGEISIINSIMVQKHARPGHWAAGEKDYLLLPWKKQLFTTPLWFKQFALYKLGVWG